MTPADVGKAFVLLIYAMACVFVCLLQVFLDGDEDTDWMYAVALIVWRVLTCVLVIVAATGSLA